MKRLHAVPVWCWLLIFSLIPLISLVTPGLPITHDGPDHVARIANFFLSLKEGILVPRWAANLNWGYGHPILMFLYPLPSYLGSLFHSIGFSFVDSTKMVFATSFVASIFSMFCWIRLQFGKKAAFISALLYGFAPYRFVDLYVRGAIGEHVAFIFPPLICYFLLNLSNSDSLKYRLCYSVGLSLSLAGLLLSHNAIALMFVPLFILYGLYLLRFEVIHTALFLLYSISSFLLGFGLSAFFWIPAFFEGKYTLRDIVTAGEVLTRFVPWHNFLYTPWSYGGTDLLSKSLGIAGIFFILASLYTLQRVKLQKYRVLLSGSLIVLVITLILMTDISKPVWVAITLLQKFQFPWRLLSLTTFIVALVGGVVSQQAWPKIQKKQQSGVFIGLCMLIVIPTVFMWHPKTYEVRDESKFTGIYESTTDTGESSPIWSVRFMEHKPKAAFDVINGEAVIDSVSRTTTKHSYVVNAKADSRILENTLYFPGWNIYIDGAKTDIQFQDPEYRGLMTYNVTTGKHLVVVQFDDTKIRKISGYISLFSGVVIVTLLIFVLWKKRK